MTPILAYLQPYDLAAAARIDVRVADAGNAEAYGLGGVSWSPYMIERPVMSLEMMAPDLDGKVQAGRARLALNPLSMPAIAGKRIKWRGAIARIYSAAALAWPAVMEFDGEVIDDNIDDDGMVSLTMEVKTDFLEGPLLVAEYTGGGGATGEAAMRGTLKPAGFGSMENIEPVWFDTTRWIGCIDGYANTSAITKLMEGLDDRGAAVANYANYAALAAAITGGSVPPGRWATCVAEGLVGLGAPPVHPIGVNATFGTNRIGALMRRVLETHRGVATGDIDTAAFAAMDTAVPYNTAYWTKDQRDCKDLIEAMAGSINATPLVTFQKKVTITRGVTSAAIAELVRSGRTTPRVIDTKRMPGQRPVYRLKARTARPANVLTYDQVLYEDTIEDKGLYQSGETYRKGHIVWSADKSSWLYINATPAAGNAPPAWPTTSNAYWQNMTPPATASNITYADGTPIENLKPAAIGADVTGANTAAAIAGQGALATANDVNWKTQVLGVGKPSNNAGSSRVLAVVGTGTTLTGNTITKTSGTHGLYEGGVIGAYQAQTCFISSSLLADSGWAGGWSTIHALDPGTGTVDPNALVDGAFYTVYVAGAVNGQLLIYKRVSGASALIGNYVVPGLTVSTRRLALVSNGRRVFVMIGDTSVGGTQYGGDTSAFDVPPGQGFYPRIFDFYRSDSLSATSDGIVDIQYGNWTDVRVRLDDGYTILNQAGFKTDEGTSAAITGQGPGATAPAADVLNYVDTAGSGNGVTIVRQPGGGVYSNEGYVTGRLKISLPVGYTSTMIRFAVDVFNYNTGTMQTYIVSGYTYGGGGPTWINVSANFIGPETASLPVRFGNDGTKACVWIGDAGSLWDYPKIVIRDVMAGYTNQSAATWKSGWALTINTTAPPTVDATVAKPRAGDAVMGESIFESAAGATATLANFKTQLGTAAAIIAQGALATKNNVDLSSPTDVISKGSIPPMVADGGFAYTATTNNLNFSWPAFTINRPDGTTATVSAGTQACISLGGSGVTWRLYPYLAEGTTTIDWNAGLLNSYGTPLIAYNPSSIPANVAMNLQGRIPLGPFNAQTPAAGSGGGGGGGSNCIHEDVMVGAMRAGDLRAGDMVPTSNGNAEVLAVRHFKTSNWIEIWSGDQMVAKTTDRHEFYRAIDGSSITAGEIRLGDLLKSTRDHVEVTGLRLCKVASIAVGLSLDDPHLHLLGPVSLLTHNGNAKP